MKVMDNIKLLHINTSSFVLAAADIASRYHFNSKSEYDDLILDLVCEPIPSKSLKESELLFGYLIQETIRHHNMGNSVGKEEAIKMAREKTDAYLAKHKWVDNIVPESVIHNSDGTATPTQSMVRTTKKRVGLSKKDQCIALYKANPGLTNRELVALFIKEVGLTEKGAPTYVHNCQPRKDKKTGATIAPLWE